jgi:hypothetical protein
VSSIFHHSPTAGIEPTVVVELIRTPVVEYVSQTRAVEVKQSQMYFPVPLVWKPRIVDLEAGIEGRRTIMVIVQPSDGLTYVGTVPDIEAALPIVGSGDDPAHVDSAAKLKSAARSGGAPGTADPMLVDDEPSSIGQ